MSAQEVAETVAVLSAAAERLDAAADGAGDGGLALSLAAGEARFAAWLLRDLGGGR